MAAAGEIASLAFAHAATALVIGLVRGARLLARVLLPRGPPPPFDELIITASDPAQAAVFRALVAARAPSLPRGLRVRCYSDPPGGRVGSGGGTLVALAMLLRDELGLTDVALASADSAPMAELAAFVARIDRAALVAFFAARRIVIVHAGGESRRLPAYVPEGKLFAPVPHCTDARAECAPVVLDPLLRLFAAYPWAAGGELLLASGDALVDFDTHDLFAPLERSSRGAGAQPPPPPSPCAQRGPIVGFGCAASFEQGSRHGVFELGAALGQRVYDVRAFHQKERAAVLAQRAALPPEAAEAAGCTCDDQRCALDIGLFALAPSWCAALVRFGCERVDGGDAPSVLARVLAGAASFDFYLEAVSAAVSPTGAGAGGEFAAAMRARGSTLAEPALRTLHAHLAPMRLRVALPRDASFVHFGSLVEFPHACAIVAARARGAGARACRFTERARCLLLNCENVRVTRLDDAGEAHDEASTGSAHASDGDTPPPARDVELGASCARAVSVLEGCSDCSLTLALGTHLLAGVRGLHLTQPLPAGMCLDARRLPAGHDALLCYACGDSFKPVAAPSDAVFCARPLLAWLAERDLTLRDVLVPVEVRARRRATCSPFDEPRRRLTRRARPRDARSHRPRRRRARNLTCGTPNSSHTATHLRRILCEAIGTLLGRRKPAGAGFSARATASHYAKQISSNQRTSATPVDRSPLATALHRMCASNQHEFFQCICDRQILR
mgnify:CR=1 FL=1